MSDKKKKVEKINKFSGGRGKQKLEENGERRWHYFEYKKWNNQIRKKELKKITKIKNKKTNSRELRKECEIVLF